MSALARFTSLDPRSLRPPLWVRRGSFRARTGALRRLAWVRARGLLLRSGLMALAAALLAAGLLAAASGLLASRPASSQALTAGAVPRWSEIRRPLALYGLAGTEFAKLPMAYGARRREPDGAREDVMTFGRLGDARPYLQLSLLRAGAGVVNPAGVAGDERADGPEDDLADGLARLAGTRGLTATRVRPAAPMDTRLGRFEAADLLLWDAGAATPCLGFRGGGDGRLGQDSAGTVLRVAGFACGAPGRPMGRAALACAIDRVDLVSAGDDAALRAVFVAAERRGAGSGGGSGGFGGAGGMTCLGGPSLAAGGGRGVGGRDMGWLDPDGDLPPLRGLFEAVSRRR